MFKQIVTKEGIHEARDGRKPCFVFFAACRGVVDRARR
jgi:hypothetical protein